MSDFLVLQLQGVMQAWGTHTYENFRPSSIFPTRSGVIGLLGACLGIKRDDIEYREKLNKSIEINVVSVNPRKIRKIQDYHTVQNARKVDGKPRKEAIVSKREYLCDASFLIFIAQKNIREVTLKNIEEAVKKPVYTPFLGRKSCPINAPLFLKYCKTEILETAISTVIKKINTDTLEDEEKDSKEIKMIKNYIIYSEEKLNDSTEYQIRDFPLKSTVRQFDNRVVHVLSREEATNVHQ